MKKALVAAAVTAACSTPLLASAQATARAKPEPEFTLSGNVTIGSDYRFRGFTQTDYQPTIQGGVDFAHKSGFYLGNWNSNVSSTLYNGAPIEMDFYGGYKRFVRRFRTRRRHHLLLLPGHRRVRRPITTRRTSRRTSAARGARLSAKYYYSFTDFFGVKAPGIRHQGFAVRRH